MKFCKNLLGIISTIASPFCSHLLIADIIGLTVEFAHDYLRNSCEIYENVSIHHTNFGFTNIMFLRDTGLLIIN